MAKIQPPDITVVNNYSTMFNGLPTMQEFYMTRGNDGLMHRGYYATAPDVPFTLSEYIEDIKNTHVIPSALKQFCYSIVDKSESSLDADTMLSCVKYIYNTYVGEAIIETVSAHKKFLKKLRYYVTEQTEEEKKNNKPLRHALAFTGDSTFPPVNDIELSPLQFEMLERYNDYCDKVKAKHEAKAALNKHFKVGDVIAIRGKIRNGSRRNIKTFVVRKIIWSINAKPVNIYILKQISGECNNMTLTKNDCKKYHVKYEENLQVYSMMLNWYFIEKMKQ